MLDQAVTMRNFFADRRVLITGSAGSLGHELKLVFKNWDLENNLTCVDISPRPGEKDFCVDLSSGLPNLWFPRVGPFDTVFHLAADKHAPAGELHARQTASVNIDSTLAVLITIYWK